MLNMLNPTIIKINNLVKDYYGKLAVNDISLEIPESCFALLGPNGAGKTTTILMLLGLIKITSGTAILLDREIPSDDLKFKSEIGYMPENVGFYPNLTGWDHLEFYERIRTNSRENGKISQFLEWCGLEQEYWNKKVRTYSRGMKQRLGLAQAFIGDPKIVILDEPLSNIDPLGREDLVGKIRQKQKEGITIIISSHIIQEIEQIADIIAIINRGRIILAGEMLEIALNNGFHEFEIKCDNLNTDNNLELIYEEITSSQELLLEKPLLLRDKIIIKTDSINTINTLINLFDKRYYLRPIEGTLMKIYKKALGDTGK